jgi:hypothetical protein
MIATLPPLTPDPQRCAQTLTRCHQRLARRRTLRAASDVRSNLNYRTIERALVGGLCVIYISGVALVAIQMLFLS